MQVVSPIRPKFRSMRVDSTVLAALRAFADRRRICTVTLALDILSHATDERLMPERIMSSLIERAEVGNPGEREFANVRTDTHERIADFAARRGLSLICAMRVLALAADVRYVPELIVDDWIAANFAPRN